MPAASSLARAAPRARRPTSTSCPKATCAVGNWKRVPWLTKPRCGRNLETRPLQRRRQRRRRLLQTENCQPIVSKAGHESGWPFSLSWRYVTFPVVNVARRGCRGQAHSDPAPLAVVLLVARLITQHVLVAQLAADEGGDFRYLATIVGGDGSAAAGVGQAAQRLPAQALLHGLEQRNGHIVKDADSIGQNIGFLDHLPGFLQAVAAVVVAAIRDNEQGPPLIARGAQFADPQINRVVESRRSLRLG